MTSCVHIADSTTRTTQDQISAQSELTLVSRDDLGTAGVGDVSLSELEVRR